METQQGVGSRGISTFLSFGAKNVQPTILEKMLVGRQKTVDILEKYARAIALNGVNNQVFIVGPRGSGKTHMIRVLYYRINALVQNKDIIVAYFAEEEYGISGYLDFLIRIINAFQRWYDADRAPLEAQLNTLRETPEKQQEYVAEQIISDYIADKPLLILSENFDAILDALGKDGQSKLRGWVYRQNRISIIATGQAMSPDMGREDRPFYGFFSTIALKKLTYEESLELLKALADIEQRPDMTTHLNGPGRAQVQAIYQLIKGNHRLLITFYEFLKADSMADLSVIFMKTMNDLKPYYETFIRFLPPQQQKILYYIALAKIPQRGADIAKNCFIATSSLTKQLSELQRQHLVDVLTDTTDKRNKLYDVSEPLLRIAIEIGEQREGITALFIDFLALYYSDEELSKQKIELEGHYQNEIEPLRKQKLYYEIDARDRAMQVRNQLAATIKPAISKQPQKKLLSTELSADIYFQKGNLFYDQGSYDLAIEAYQKALSIKPDNIEVWNSLGIVYYDQGVYESAIKAFRRVVDIRPNDHEAWNNLGIAYGMQEAYEPAVEAFRQALDIKPDKHEAWYNLGVAHTNQGAYELAVEAYQKTLEIEPDEQDAASNLGNAYFNQGHYDLAVEAYQKVLMIKPEDPEIWYKLGNSHREQEKYELATNDYQKAVTIKPDMHEAWNNLGIAYGMQEAYEPAVEAFRQALDIKPDKHEAWYNLGNAYFNQGHYKLAVESYQKAIVIKPKEHDALYNLGLAYESQGNYKLAIEAYQKEFELQPSDIDILNRLPEVIVKLLKAKIATEVELVSLETWLHNRTGFEIISSYVTTYRRVVFDKEEQALYELPKEQRIFFEKEILQRQLE